MKKDKIRWGIGLGVLLVLYILVAFLVPFVHTATFWVSFLFTLISFGVVAASFYIAFIKNPDARSRFYGFPIARIGVLYGLAQLPAGILFMTLGAVVPAWVALLVYAIALGVAVIGLISAEAVVEEIRIQDVKLKKDVALMRGLQSKVLQMAAQCENPDVFAAVKQFAEDLRYSDPVSSEAIAEIEADLSAAVDELQAAIVDGDNNVVRQLCRKASALLAERNRLCKLNKHDDFPTPPVVEAPKAPVAQEAPKKQISGKTVKIVAIAAVALCAVLVLAVLLNAVVIPGVRYSNAVKLMEKGSAVEAYEALTAMEGYKDTAEKAASIYDRYRLELLQTAAVGDVVLLGSYEQDGDAANGKEDVSWIVLDEKDGQLLLVSRYGLDFQPYHETREAITWENSTLRQWLNNGFLNSVFTDLEKEHIPVVTVTAEGNTLYQAHAKPGEDTEDQIFLLSAGEVSRYFSSRNDRICQKVGTEEVCSWWLRNPGHYQRYATVIDTNGDVNENGEEGHSNEIAVRPALWVDVQP